MAGDWIKMKCNLGTDPKVARLAIELRKSIWFAKAVGDAVSTESPISDVALRHVVTGALHAVWSAANEHAQDGLISGATLEWIDVICGLPDFGKAMQAVSWATVCNEGLRLPKFEVNNTSGAERQRRYREKFKSKSPENSDESSYVTVTSPLRAREERSGEEELPYRPGAKPTGTTKMNFEELPDWPELAKWKQRSVEPLDFDALSESLKATLTGKRAWEPLEESWLRNTDNLFGWFQWQQTLSQPVLANSYAAFVLVLCAAEDALALPKSSVRRSRVGAFVTTVKQRRWDNVRDRLPLALKRLGEVL